MRRAHLGIPVLFLLASSTSVIAQTTTQATITPPVRDQQAITVLRQAFAALGGALPADSVATGTVTIVAGSSTETGNIRILTRGVDQTVEDVETGSGRRVVTFSHIMASETRGGATKLLSFESSASSQAFDFPLPFIDWALTNKDAASTYLGLESVDGAPAHHIRLWNSFASAKHRPPLEITIRDLWIDATTGLPLRLACVRRESGGSAPRISLMFSYSDFRNVSGVLYPFQIQKSLNGTPWTTITISRVNFNTGLSDSDFPLPTGRQQ